MLKSMVGQKCINCKVPMDKPKVEHKPTCPDYKAPKKI